MQIERHTTAVLKERDQTRKKISEARNEEKPMLKAKYKNLRNRVISQIRKDTIQRNGEKISEASPNAYEF